MSRRIDELGAGLYRTLWVWVERWLRVPRDPPTLPVAEGEAVESFRPAPGFLSYLKFAFWIVLLVIDLGILLVWVIITAVIWWLGLLLLPLALVVAIVPDIVAYIALHFRYDTTWYVMTDRSLRIRRGIWTIHEVSITFENVQNVRVTQGPLQRYFGIADVVVETAGGGAVQGHSQMAVGNCGLIEGVADADRIRDTILKRLKASRSAGLGDEAEEEPSARGGTTWGPEHLSALREILAECRRLPR